MLKFRAIVFKCLIILVIIIISFNIKSFCTGFIISPIIYGNNKWIYLCRNDILIRGIQTSSSSEITALITCYNCKEYIKTAIKSVQNQIFKDIEIVVVEDGSIDNSYSIIKNIEKDDKRIKISYYFNKYNSLYYNNFFIFIYNIS